MVTSQLHSYIALQQSKLGDAFDSDRLRPIEGTVLRDDLAEAKPYGTQDDLFFQIGDMNSDEEDDADENKNIAYWQPKCGDISIITRDLAEDISDATGCFLDPDLPGQKVRLAQGNIQLALEKLERLEHVFVSSQVPSMLMNATCICLCSSTDFARPFPNHSHQSRPHTITCSYHRLVLAQRSSL